MQDSPQITRIAAEFDGEVCYERNKWTPCHQWVKRRRKHNPWKEPPKDPYGTMLAVKATVTEVACVPQGSDMALVFPRNAVESTDPPLNPVRPWWGVIEPAGAGEK